jgi:hypothetical protein
MGRGNSRERGGGQTCLLECHALQRLQRQQRAGRVGFRAQQRRRHRPGARIDCHAACRERRRGRADGRPARARMRACAAPPPVSARIRAAAAGPAAPRDRPPP